MKQYIKVNEKVTAKPMTVKEFYEQTLQSQYWEMIENGDGDKEGYFIRDDNGYGIPYWTPKDKFEEQYRKADTPLNRMVIELDDLNEKVDKLYIFFNTDKFKELDTETQAMLMAQSHIMEEYKGLLVARASKMEDEGQNTEREPVTFSFVIANAMLQSGFVVCRKNWKEGLVIIRQVPAHITQDIIPNMQSLPTKAKNLILKEKGFVSYQNQCLIYNTSTGVANSWAPSADDIFAEDWMVVTD